MPQIQFDIPKDLDKKLKHYMIDNDVIDKRVAIVNILEKCLNKHGGTWKWKC